MTETPSCQSTRFQRAANPRSKAKQRLSEQMVAHLDQSGMDDESEQGQVDEYVLSERYA